MKEMKIRGPWKVEDDVLALIYGRLAVEIKEPGGEIVGYIYPDDGYCHNQDNARLVAYAPELLKFVVEAWSYLAGECEDGFVEWNDYATAKDLAITARRLLEKIQGEG